MLFLLRWLTSYKIQFNHITEDNKIYAFPSPVQHEKEVLQIDEEIEKLGGMIDEWGFCRISSTGTVHSSKELCPNRVYDEDLHFSCPVRDIYHKECLKDRIRNAPAALRFYWAMRKSPMPLLELRDAGFVHTYE